MTAPFRSWAEDYPHATRRDFPPIDRELVARSMRNRGRIVALAKSGKGGQSATKARLIMGGHDENARRAADPLEQAKLHLQRRGYVVFRADIVGGDIALWVVGSRPQRLTSDELIALARRHGFTPKQKDHANV